MKRLFIVNPAAGKGKPISLIPYIEKLAAGDSYAIQQSEYANHAYELAREESKNNWDTIYAVGGDGTINEVVNGIIGTDINLGIIPCGSGNDFIKTLDEKYDRKLFIEDIVKRYIGKNIKAIDVATVNDRYFVNISSAGFDAAVVINREKIKRCPFISGWLAYYISVFYTLIKNRKYIFDISIDSSIHLSGKYTLVTVSNGKYYGGGMTPTPDADITDGKLDLCLIDTMSRFKIIKFFGKFIKGKHAGVSGVSFYSGKCIEIKSPHIFPVNIDGELTFSNHAIFNIKPSALRVIVP